MGWKASVIIVNNPTKEVAETDLLHQLGFNGLLKVEDTLLESAIYPEDDMVYVGMINNNFIICSDNLAIDTLDSYVSDGESVLSNLFPDSEICSLVLHSSVNLWGYSVTKNNQKLRARAGSHDSGTTVDYGVPFSEEEYLLNNSKLIENGQRVYIFSETQTEPYTEDQVGENFVFALSEKYFGQKLDESDILFSSKLSSYRINVFEENKADEIQEVNIDALETTQVLANNHVSDVEVLESVEVKVDTIEKVKTIEENVKVPQKNESINVNNDTMPKEAPKAKKPWWKFW